MSLSSPSVPRHLLRGVLGLVALVAAVAGATVTPLALLGLVATIVAWRGCPTCWLVGLMQTIERCDCSSSPASGRRLADEQRSPR